MGPEKEVAATPNKVSTQYPAVPSIGTGEHSRAFHRKGHSRECLGNRSRGKKKNSFFSQTARGKGRHGTIPRKAKGCTTAPITDTRTNLACLCSEQQWEFRQLEDHLQLQLQSGATRVRVDPNTALSGKETTPHFNKSRNSRSLLFGVRQQSIQERA